MLIAMVDRLTVRLADCARPYRTLGVSELETGGQDDGDRLRRSEIYAVAVAVIIAFIAPSKNYSDRVLIDDEPEKGAKIPHLRPLSSTAPPRADLATEAL
ncbi:uncharacterized protein BT62DRAFT_1010877 [Guyanagaster necrorhizus]|uniref:Uncharacterized protein n=1 Tax=Guyanagaster necrorhizus TaxID=856835 RepID=A0A9P7VJ61_9AGAR|nr:uncharacterized protein BT62DRAFT_1010877 [Guyanagaster necrorhizus MCA 3950]KAG7442096.1 hypothetical protein BT62DRAFT_1010877 [Guyanagaster necrorhizus MCA 3950]